MALSGVTGGSAVESAYGLNFQSLLQIILAQLTYQDPLKPMDNFQFVSQLAQFSQLQQEQSLNDKLTSLISAQATTQATTLLGKTVDATSGTGVISGTVSAISFSSGSPTLTIKTSSGATLSQIALSSVSQVR